MHFFPKYLEVSIILYTFAVCYCYGTILIALFPLELAPRKRNEEQFIHLRSMRLIAWTSP